MSGVQIIWCFRLTGERKEGKGRAKEGKEEGRERKRRYEEGQNDFYLP
jgi:hypothetical protein